MGANLSEVFSLWGPWLQEGIGCSFLDLPRLWDRTRQGCQCRQEHPRRRAGGEIKRTWSRE